MLGGDWRLVRFRLGTVADGVFEYPIFGTYDMVCFKLMLEGYP